MKKNFKINFLKVLKKDCKKIIAVAILAVLGVFFFLPVEAQSGRDQMKTVCTESIPLSYIFTIHFLTLVHSKSSPRLQKLQSRQTPNLPKKSLFLDHYFPVLPFLIAALWGNTILKKFDIALPLLALSAGIILFIVALLAINQQLKPLSQDETKMVPTLKMALMLLAFPPRRTFGSMELIQKNKKDCRRPDVEL